ncbi:MAG: hypothetical protein V1685_00430 [Parcubacteria group bacterium]
MNFATGGWRSWPSPLSPSSLMRSGSGEQFTIARGQRPLPDLDRLPKTQTRKEVVMPDDIITHVFRIDSLTPPPDSNTQDSGSTWPYWVVAAFCIIGAIAVMLIKFPDPKPILPLWLNKPWCVMIAVGCLFGAAVALMVVYRERQRKKENQS